MSIISLIILNAWRKFTAPGNLRILATVSVILLAATQLFIFLAVIPGFGKIPVSLSVSVKELLDPKGRSLVEIWAILMNVVTLIVLRLKALFILLSLLFAGLSALAINSFSDRTLEENKLKAAFLAASAAGAVIVLAVIELGAFLIPVISVSPVKG